MRPNGVFKKPAMMASNGFSTVLGQLSKAALIDVLWCACQLGTDESADQILSQAARNAVIALESRGDRVPGNVRAVAETPIDSD